MVHFIPHQISLLCNYHFPLSLSQWQNCWGEYLEKYASKSQRGKHLRGTPQWMRIWRMLIKQCHDLLSVTKHLQFQSQRLGFLENVWFGHSSVNFTSGCNWGFRKSRPPLWYGLCQATYVYLFKQKLQCKTDYSFNERCCTFPINDFYPEAVFRCWKLFKVRKLMSSHKNPDQFKQPVSSLQDVNKDFLSLQTLNILHLVKPLSSLTYL